MCIYIYVYIYIICRHVKTGLQPNLLGGGFLIAFSAAKLHSHILPTATDGRTGSILGVCEIDPENRGYRIKTLGST